MKLGNLLDVTLRDGALGLGFPYSADESERYLNALRSVGVQHAEVGFIEGPAGPPRDSTSPNYALSGGAEALSPPAGLRLHAMAEAANDRVVRALRRQPLYSGFIRITSNSNDLSTADPIMRILVQQQQRFAVNLKHSGTYEVGDVVACARAAKSCGASSFYIVDTGGAMDPQQVAGQVAAVLDADLDLEIGFHGHDNLGLAVANSLAAERSGATLIDASLGGIGAGAGNTPLETLLFLCDDISDTHLLQFSELYESLGGRISPNLGRAALWGRVRARSGERASLAQAAESAGVSVETLAWRWGVGREIASSAHSRVELRSTDAGQPRVRKVTLGLASSDDAEVTAMERLRERGLPVVPVIARGRTVEGGPWFEMPVADGTLRDLVSESDSGTAGSHSLVRAVAALMALWTQAPDGMLSASSFVEEYYLQRPLNRLQAAIAKSRPASTALVGADDISPTVLMAEIARAESVIIDGTSYLGPRHLIHALMGQRHLCSPRDEDLGLIHGDPHLGNILTTGEMPQFIDPGIFPDGGDPAYDIAKLLVSISGSDPEIATVEPFGFESVGRQVSVTGFRFEQNPGAVWMRRVWERECRPAISRMNGGERALDRADVVLGVHLISHSTTMPHLGWKSSAILLEGIRRLGKALEVDA